MADMELVKKGRNEPRLGIVQQLAVLIVLAKLHETVLARFGWTPADTAELERVHALLKSELAEQVEAKDASRLSTKGQNAALSEAKELKRLIDRAVRRVFRREKNLPVTQDAFSPGGTIGKSVPKMLAWLNNVKPLVAAIEAQLKARMGGVEPVAAITAAAAALESADVAQETSLADLPGDTLEVYEAKGLALLLIEELNDAGRAAFDGDANEAGKFNKDLIVRARKQRPVKVPKVA